MLTKQDLQQIRTIVKEEAGSVVREETPKIVRPIVQEEIKIALKPVNRKLNRVEKDLSYVIRTYDERLVSLEKDVKVLKQN